MNTKEFAKTAQGLLPEHIIAELEQIQHTGTITTTCRGHMLLSYILEYGATIVAQQLDKDEFKTTIWNDITRFIDSVNEEHFASLDLLRERYPEEFAEAEAQALQSANDKDHRMALLREMLGQDRQN